MRRRVILPVCFFLVPLLYAVQPVVSGEKGGGIQIESSGVLPDRDVLEMEKLRQDALKTRHECVKLQMEVENMKGPWAKFASSTAPLAPFITAIVAVLGVVLTIWKQVSENTRQRELDRRQREVESQRRVDDKFTSIVTNIGSESEAVQASAVVSLTTFLKPEYEFLHDQAFTIVLANLKITHSNPVNRLLVDAFEKALRIRMDAVKGKRDEFELDLSRASLKLVNLSELDLSNADLGFAQMQQANLRRANLFRVRGYGANLERARLKQANLNEARLQKSVLKGAHFHGTNLVAADLKECDLTGAQFCQAKMQSAHLEGANITGARFEQANLSDTYFLGVQTDTQALRSLMKAVNWQEAHFDEEVKSSLEQMARQANLKKQQEESDP